MKKTLYQGEVFALYLGVHLEPAWLGKHAIQRSAQSLDFPLEIEATALRVLPHATLLPTGPRRTSADAEPASVALNGERVEVLQGFHPIRPALSGWLSLGKRWLVNEAGAIEVPAATVRFAYASEFTEDALGTRVPVGVKEHVVHGEPVTLTVVPLPTEGRPADFGGAIGRFTLAAAAARAEVEVGQTFRVTLTIEGEGNLEIFEPPRLDPRSGFHVYGVTDDRAYPKRTLVYDLTPQRADVTAVPALTLLTFDPSPPATYRTMSSAPIPLTVRPRPGSSPTPAPAPGAAEQAHDASGSRFLVAGLVAALLIVAGVALVRRRGRRSGGATPLDAGEARLQAALAELRGRAAHPGADLSEVFSEVVAARLRQPRAAAVAPDLAARLTAAGVGSAAAAEAAKTMEHLVGARYGGAALDAAARDRIFTIAARLRETGERA